MSTVVGYWKVRPQGLWYGRWIDAVDAVTVKRTLNTLVCYLFTCLWHRSIGHSRESTEGVVVSVRSRLLVHWWGKSTVDFKTIAIDNWLFFQKLFGRGRANVREHSRNGRFDQIVDYGSPLSHFAMLSYRRVRYSATGSSLGHTFIFLDQLLCEMLPRVRDLWSFRIWLPIRIDLSPQ